MMMLKYFSHDAKTTFSSLDQKGSYHGAQTTLYCTLDDKIECESGLYYSDCAVAPTLTPHAEDMEAAKKLWELSEQLTALKEEV